MKLLAWSAARSAQLPSKTRSDRTRDTLSAKNSAESDYIQPYKTIVANDLKFGERLIIFCRHIKILRFSFRIVGIRQKVQPTKRIADYYF